MGGSAGGERHRDFHMHSSGSAYDEVSEARQDHQRSFECGSQRTASLVALCCFERRRHGDDPRLGPRAGGIRDHGQCDCSGVRSPRSDPPNLAISW